MTRILCKETGRTLVETLSVLAIMGILSVGGLWAYHNAINKNKANTLIHEAQKRAVVIAAQIGFHNQTPSLDEFDNDTSVGKFELIYYGEGSGLKKQFGLQVSGVDKSICQHVLNSIGGQSSIRRISYPAQATIALDECGAAGETYLFVYNENLSGTDKESSSSTGQNTNGTEQGSVEEGGSSSTGQISDGTEQGSSGEGESAPIEQCSADSECGPEDKCSICDDGTKTCRHNACQTVEYLKSANTRKQYINTGLYPKLNTYTVECKAIKETGYSLFGADSQFNLTGNSSIHFARYDEKYPSDKTEQPTSGYTTSSGSVHIWKLAKNNLYVDGALKDTFTLKTKTATVPLYLFSRGANNDAGTHTIYYCKVWDGETLVRDFVPVLKRNKPALLDRVNNKLYFNAGSGEFTTGNI